MVARGAQIGVYIMANRKHGVLYIGVTAQLTARVITHRDGLVPGFTKTHGCTRLVWYEPHAFMVQAIQREKTMKRWPREWKVNLIERDNPDWNDRYLELFG